MAHGEVYVGLATRRCIEGTFHQMLFHGGTGSLGIVVEQKHALRQLPIVQSLLKEHVGNDLLVLSFLNEIFDGFSFILPAYGIERIVEGKMLDVLKILLFKGRGGRVVVCIEKCEHILEHSAGSTTCRNKLHDFVSLLLIFIPDVDIDFFVVLIGCHDSIFDTCGSLQSEEWKSGLKLAQLCLNLLFGNAFLGNLL